MQKGTYIIYGIGGYCAECDDSHNHPLYNIIDSGEYDLPEEES
jgi:hypothetical protein